MVLLRQLVLSMATYKKTQPSFCNCLDNGQMSFDHTDLDYSCLPIETYGDMVLLLLAQLMASMTKQKKKSVLANWQDQEHCRRYFAW